MSIGVSIILIALCVVVVSGIAIEQVHISLGGGLDANVTDMFVNFVTVVKPAHSTIAFGTDQRALKRVAESRVTTFVDGGAKSTVRYMHEAHLTPLDVNSTVFYQITVADEKGNNDTSDVFRFNTLSPQAGYTRPLKLALFGDYGLTNGQSHAMLDAASAAGDIDVVLHCGDIAYNLADNDGQTGDQFMNREQSWATRTPWMVAPGNHEYAYNFSHYNYRFHMPNDVSGSPTNQYSSFNIGSVHVISFNAEAYFFDDDFSMDYIRAQYEWLVNDLAVANKNRHVRPWIVVFAHRPMYCTASTNDDSDCTINTYRIRDGVNWNGGQRQYGLERLFYESGVDVYLSGHEHSYERLYPVYRQQLLSQSYDPLIAPFYLVAGAAGCDEYIDTWDEATIYPYSASRSDSYGYGVLTVQNTTHALWQQIHDADGAVLDSVWLVKPRTHSNIANS